MFIVNNNSIIQFVLIIVNANVLKVRKYTKYVGKTRIMIINHLGYIFMKKLIYKMVN